ncbi:MAG: MBL fold metallo-hydrolase [Pyrinomonadaceae bacterium]
MLEKHGRTIVFGGDTAYTKAFARLGRRLSRVDLAILPIGAYDPYIHVHASPEQAWAMGRDLNATYLLPIHHSTFKLSREAVREPITRFLRAAAHDRWRVPITEVGQMWVMPED